jgi:8-oxo-dGTP diphosphatase
MILESKTPIKKRLRVVAAIIHKDDKIFCAQRATAFSKENGSSPAAKSNPAKPQKQALIREIKEELDTAIVIDGFFMNVVYEYPEFTLDMDVFDAHVKQGRLEIEKGIHSAEAWLSSVTLQEEDWCPADAKIVKHIKEFASPLN